MGLSGTSSGLAWAPENCQLPSQADLPTEPGLSEGSVGGPPEAARMSHIEFSRAPDTPCVSGTPPARGCGLVAPAGSSVNPTGHLRQHPGSFRGIDAAPRCLEEVETPVCSPKLEDMWLLGVVGGWAG